MFNSTFLPCHVSPSIAPKHESSPPFRLVSVIGISASARSVHTYTILGTPVFSSHLWLPRVLWPDYSETVCFHLFIHLFNFNFLRAVHLHYKRTGIILIIFDQTQNNYLPLCPQIFRFNFLSTETEHSPRNMVYPRWYKKYMKRHSEICTLSTGTVYQQILLSCKSSKFAKWLYLCNYIYIYIYIYKA